MTYKFKVKQRSTPEVEPITLDEIKTYLKIDGDEEDDVLTGLIVSARQACEAFTGQALINRELSLFLDYFPKEGEVYLPYPPLSSVTQVLVYDEAGNSTVWSSDHYMVDDVGLRPRLVLKNSGALPTPTRKVNGIEVQYVSGYGDLGSDVPKPLTEGIKKAIAHGFENRGDVNADIQKSGAHYLWQSFRNVGVS